MSKGVDIVPYMPDPIPTYAVGAVVTITFRVRHIVDGTKTAADAFPFTLYGNGTWTKSDGTQVGVGHVVLAEVGIEDVVAVTSGQKTLANGNLWTWTEYTYALDTSTAPVPSVDWSGTPVDLGLVWASGTYELCFDMNGLHHGLDAGENSVELWDYKRFRGQFILTPYGDTLYDDLPLRTDLHSRTAGEKAIYDDEFVTKGQLEEGHGVSFIYRDDVGATTEVEYSTVAANRQHVIIDSKGLETTYVDRYGNETVFAQVWSRKHRFADTPEHRWILTPEGATGAFGSPTMKIEGKHVFPVYLHDTYITDLSGNMPSTVFGITVNPDDYEVDYWDTSPQTNGTIDRYGDAKGIAFWSQLQRWDSYPGSTGDYTETPFPAYWKHIQIGVHAGTPQPNEVYVSFFGQNNKLNVVTSQAGASPAVTIDWHASSLGLLVQDQELIDNTQYITFATSPDTSPIANDVQSGDVNFYLDKVTYNPSSDYSKRVGVLVRAKLREGLLPNVHVQREWAANANGATNVGAPLAGGSGVYLPLPWSHYTGGTDTFGPTLSTQFQAPAAGWYEYQCVTAGEHVNDGSAYPLARYDLYLYAEIFDPSIGGWGIEQQLANTTWIDYDAIFGVPIDAGGGVATMLDSIPWSLQGSGRVWLEQNQLCRFTIGMKGAAGWVGATSRVFYVRYSRAEMMLYSTDPAQPGERNRKSFVGYGLNVNAWNAYNLNP